MLRIFLKAFGLDWLLPVPFEKIDAKSAQNIVSDRHALFVDVRQPKEWEKTGVPEHSVGLSMNDDAFVPAITELVGGDKGQKIILTCLTGKRAQEAAFTLHANGFKNLAVLDGGIIAWEEQKLPITYEKSYI